MTHKRLIKKGTTRICKYKNLAEFIFYLKSQVNGRTIGYIYTF